MGSENRRLQVCTHEIEYAELTARRRGDRGPAQVLVNQRTRLCAKTGSRAPTYPPATEPASRYHPRIQLGSSAARTPDTVPRLVGLDRQPGREPEVPRFQAWPLALVLPTRHTPRRRSATSPSVAVLAHAKDQGDRRSIDVQQRHRGRQRRSQL